MDSINFDAIELFRQLGRVDRARLIPHFVRHRFKAGEVLVKQGDPGDALFIIVEGNARVDVTSDGKERITVATLASGECFGEISLLTGEKRSADVIAETPLVAMRLSRTRFIYLMETHHSLALQVSKILAGRISATNKALREAIETSPDKYHKVEYEVLQSSAEFKAGWSLNKPLEKRRLFSLMMTACIGGAAWFVLKDTGMTTAQFILLDLLLAATIAWCFGAFSYHGIALSLPLLAVVFGAAQPNAAFSGFNSPTWFLMLGVFAIASAVSRTGLIYRLVLKVIQIFPSGYKWQSFALAAAGLILTPVIPSSNGRTVLAGPIVSNMAEILRFRRGSTGAVGLSLAALLGFGHMSFLFMNGNALGLLALGLLPPDVSSRVTWGSWFITALPLGIVFFVLSFASIMITYRIKRVRPGKGDVVNAQLDALGMMGKNEKITLATVSVTLAAFITQPLHSVNGAWVALLGFLVLLCGGTLTDKSIRSEIDWSFLLSFGALVGFGSVVGSSGLGVIVAAKTEALQKFVSWSPYLFLGSIAIYMNVLRIALPLAVAQLICILSITPVIGRVGIDPFVGCLVVLVSGNPWFFPYQDSNFISLSESTEGNLLKHKLTLPAAWLRVAVVLVSVMVSVPYWKYLGLIQG